MAFKTLLFLLSFIGCCAGEDILPAGPLDAVLGKTVTLRTLLVKPSYAFITWNFDDGSDSVNIATVSATTLNVNGPYQGRVALNNTNGYLTLGPLKSEDSGKYTITIISSAGIASTAETELRVLEPVSNVVIKSNLPEAIEHNSTVVLNCSAKGSFLKFSWLKGTTPIVADGKRITVKDEEMSSALTVTGILRTDLVGPIYCTATNKLESEKSAGFNLTVYYGPEKVTITPSSTPKFVRSKSAFNLTCSAVSNPPASFVWYHDNKMMEAGGPVLDLKVIEAHKFGDKAGEFTCRAENTKTKRIVFSPPVTFGVMEAISGAKVMGPTATLIAGNSTANLSCKATAGTVQTVTWRKDGQPLSADGHLKFSPDMRSIMIDPLQKEDNGEYTCELTNPVNTEKASYKMMVNYGPEAATVTGQTAVEVNDAVTLTCAADSIPPANFTWKFNGTMTAVKTAQYSIEMAKYQNTGTYTCMAYNSVTGKSSMYTHTLSVKEEGALDTLSDGAIAGIVIGVLVALGAAIALVMYCRQKVPVESPY